MLKQRIFISHRRDENGDELLEKVVAVLRENNQEPLYDRDFKAAREIAESVESGIERSHWLLVLSTENDVWERAWIQQEIGYARACRIPIIVANLAGVKESNRGFVGFQTSLTAKTEQELLDNIGSFEWNNPPKSSGPPIAMFRRDTSHEGRVKAIEASADKIKPPAMIRQRSKLSSFSLPDSRNDANWAPLKAKKLNWPIWALPEEKVALQKTVSGHEIRLIIDPFEMPRGYDATIQECRLNSLLSFLRCAPGKVNVAVDRVARLGSVTIIGTEWLAVSGDVPPNRSDRQTMSTWHASTVRDYVEQFDHEFEQLFNVQPGSHGDPRSYAISLIHHALKSL